MRVDLAVERHTSRIDEPTHRLGPDLQNDAIAQAIRTRLAEVRDAVDHLVGLASEAGVAIQ